VARAHVVMSDEVLEAIDDVVGKRGRSRFIEQAAKEKLERVALARSLEATAGALRGRGYRHWDDRTSTAAWVRKTRRTESRD